MRFCRLLFGITSSPFLLNVTVRSHVRYYKEIQPDIAQTLLSSLHVDNFNTGASTLREVFDLCVNPKNVLKEGSFHFRKFKSNNTELENQVYSKYPEDKEHSREQNWNKTSDDFMFDLKKIRNKFGQKPTKRKNLHSLASIFDPLGLLTRFVSVSKIFSKMLAN